MCVQCASGVSRNQYCNDQHWSAVTGVLQLWRGTLQVTFLFSTVSLCASEVWSLCRWSITHHSVCSFSFSFRLQAQHLPFQPAGELGLEHGRVLHCGRWWPHRGQRSDQVSSTRLCPCRSLLSSWVKVADLCVSVSGSVWSSYRKSCVNTVMKWLVPESSSRYINRMTNEALHKGELDT